jgi:hypothetical protein
MPEVSRGATAYCGSFLERSYGPLAISRPYLPERTLYPLPQRHGPPVGHVGAGASYLLRALLPQPGGHPLQPGSALGSRRYPSSATRSTTTLTQVSPRMTQVRFTIFRSRESASRRRSSSR